MFLHLEYCKDVSSFSHYVCFRVWFGLHLIHLLKYVWRQRLAWHVFERLRPYPGFGILLVCYIACEMGMVSLECVWMRENHVRLPSCILSHGWSCLSHAGVLIGCTQTNHPAPLKVCINADFKDKERETETLMLFSVGNLDDTLLLQGSTFFSRLPSQISSSYIYYQYTFMVT